VGKRGMGNGSYDEVCVDVFAGCGGGGGCRRLRGCRGRGRGFGCFCCS
jgi:hypothetical protein